MSNGSLEQDLANKNALIAKLKAVPTNSEIESKIHGLTQKLSDANQEIDMLKTQNAQYCITHYCILINYIVIESSTKQDMIDELERQLLAFNSNTNDTSKEEEMKLHLVEKDHKIADLERRLKEAEEKAARS